MKRLRFGEDVVARVRALAAEGVHLAEAARRLPLKYCTLWRLARRHAIAFAPPRRDLYSALGQASAASPRHHTFTDAERHKAHGTRKGHRNAEGPDVQAMRRRAFESAYARAFGGPR